MLERHPDEAAIEFESSFLGVFHIRIFRFHVLTRPILVAIRCTSICPTLWMRSARISNGIGRVGREQDCTLVAHQPLNVLSLGCITAEQAMLTDPPELIVAGTPFPLELARLVDLRRRLSLRMEHIPQLRACRTPQELFKRLIVGFHRFEKRSDSLGVGLG
jgi:hypothetical protein